MGGSFTKLQRLIIIFTGSGPPQSTRRSSDQPAIHNKYTKNIIYYKTVCTRYVGIKFIFYREDHSIRRKLLGTMYRCRISYFPTGVTNAYATYWFYNNEDAYSFIEFFQIRVHVVSTDYQIL